MSKSELRSFPTFSIIGVVGAGVIGSGVAQLLAETGHQVVLVDTAQEQLDAARKTIASNARLYRLFRKSSCGAAEALGRIRFSHDHDALAASAFVIENITEDREQKFQVHAIVDRLVGPDVPVAANTSAIPITHLASAHRRPQRVIGMHFMNPPPLMPTVELIRGAHTSEETVEAARVLVKEVGCESILVNDSPGFVTNRVMMLMINEAIFLLQEGVASAPDIDRLFKTCFGHKMGPLETADLIGLDTVLRSIEVIYAELNDSKYRPCSILKKMVYAGQIGRKSGRGFYQYEAMERRAE